jgi:hypothetical protein
MNQSGSVACLLAVLVLPLAACSTAPAPAPVPASPTAPLPKVEVAMYSGRPDPSFTLTREQADALRACRGTGTAKPAGPIPDERLGFRFFDVIGLESAPLLVGVDGAWLDKGGEPTPVALCPDGFSILRDAAVKALPSDVSGALPEV